MQEYEMEAEMTTSSQNNGKGEGDAYLLRAIGHLLSLTKQTERGPGNGDATAASAENEATTEEEERLLSALLLCTRLESADDRRRFLLPKSNTNGSGGPALGWFALALIRQYVQGDSGDKNGQEDGRKVDEQAARVSLALLRLAIRSLSLLYAEMTSATILVSSKTGKSDNDFHSTCRGVMLDVLEYRSNGANAIQEVDVEIAAILTLMDQKNMLALNAGHRIHCAQILMSRYRSSVGSCDDRAKMEVGSDIVTVQDGTSSPEQPSADEMMVRVIQSALGEISGDDEAEKVGQYTQIVAHYINSLLERDDCRTIVSAEKLLLGLIEASAPSSDKSTVFLPVALRAIGLNTFGILSNSSEGDTNHINMKVAPAILKLLLTSLARPDNELAIRFQIYAAIAALADTFGLRWMTDATIAAKTPTESDLGAAASCCTLIRLAAGELRIALGWILGDNDDDKTEPNGDPAISMIYMDIVRHCLSISKSALKLMIDLSEALYDEDAPLPSDFGPFAILHVRHSILDAVDSCIQYLNEKPHQRSPLNGSPLNGRFNCVWDFCSDPTKGTAHGLRMIGLQCSHFLFAYVSDTDIFEDEASGMSESIPSAGTILSAMHASLQLASCNGMNEGEMKVFGHFYQKDDIVAPLLPGLAAILSPFVADDSHGMESRTKPIEDSLFTDSMLSDCIANTLQRLAGSIEGAMDNQSDIHYEKITSLLASLDLCALVLDGIISFHMKVMPFGLAEMSKQQTHLLDMLAQMIFILLEGVENFPKIIQGHADQLTRHAAIQSLDRLVSCWNHVVDIGCADMESSALKKAAGYVTLAELAVEERSEYLHF